jgi:hypothetical protein
MTPEAESIAVLFQDELPDDAVADVAGLAVVVLHTGVKGLLLLEPRGERLVAFDARLRLELPRLRRLGVAGEGAKQEKRRQDAEDA